MEKANTFEDEDPKAQVQEQIAKLRQQIAMQQGFLNGCSKYEGEDLYEQLKQLEKVRIAKQSEYKSLMRDHFKFVRFSYLQTHSDKYLEDKLKKTIMNLNQQIGSLLSSRTSKSSISSSSSHSNVDYSDWLIQQKEEKYEKQLVQIEKEIKELKKITEQME